jgi:hypothetical protein
MYYLERAGPSTCRRFVLLSLPVQGPSSALRRLILRIAMMKGTHLKKKSVPFRTSPGSYLTYLFNFTFNLPLSINFAVQWCVSLADFSFISFLQTVTMIITFN